MKRPPKKASSALSETFMARVVYFLDENGFIRKGAVIEQQYKLFRSKLTISRKKILDQFIRNAREKGTPTTGSLSSVELHKVVLSNQETTELLEIMKPHWTKKAKTRPTTKSTDKQEILQNLAIYHFDEEPNEVYRTPQFQAFTRKMHSYARRFVREKMSALMLETFDQIYPEATPNPRYMFVNNYQKGSMDTIGQHRDQVSFLTIVIALEGDDTDEPKENCLRISSIFEPQVPAESEYFKLDSGDAVIFERMYHSVISSSKRIARRITVNIFF